MIPLVWDVDQNSATAQASILQRLVSWFFDLWSKRTKRKLAKHVKECFDGVDWSNHIFHLNGQTIKTNDGTDRFYKAPPIEEAIKKLNKVLDDYS